MMFGISTLITFASEVTSNTALTATMMPVIAAAAESLRIDPEAPLFAMVFAACSLHDAGGYAPERDRLRYGAPQDR